MVEFDSELRVGDCGYIETTLSLMEIQVGRFQWWRRLTIGQILLFKLMIQLLLSDHSLQQLEFASLSAGNRKQIHGLLSTRTARWTGKVEPLRVVRLGTPKATSFWPTRPILGVAPLLERNYVEFWKE
ncbi:hypothetical protein LINPERHAP2_LOCUS24873 [Linum perenne]